MSESMTDKIELQIKRENVYVGDASGKVFQHLVIEQMWPLTNYQGKLHAYGWGEPDLDAEFEKTQTLKFLDGYGVWLPEEEDKKNG